ncbi:MAG: hypothetical protein ACJ8GN_28070 [Longimicrobiaceae bacterium]
MVRCALAAAGMLLAPGRVAAQAPTGVVVGDSVRVTAPGLGPAIRGELAAVRGDTMFVRRYAATLGVPMSRVERIDVRRRRSALRGLGRGVAYGAPLGLAAGFLLGVAVHGGGNPDCADDCNQALTVGAASGLAMGTVLGAVIGVSSPGSRWERTWSRPGVAIAFNVKP